MEEVRTRTLVLPDPRDPDRCLRVSWHPTTATVVFSHWSGPVCTASTPVSLAEASRLVDLLVGALRGVVVEAAARPEPGPTPMSPSGRAGFLARLRRDPAVIAELPRRLRDQWGRRAAR